MYYVIYQTVSGQFRRDFSGFLSAFRFAHQLEQTTGINACLAYVFRHGKTASVYRRQVARPAAPQTQLAWN